MKEMGSTLAGGQLHAEATAVLPWGACDAPPVVSGARGYPSQPDSSNTKRSRSLGYPFQRFQASCWVSDCSVHHQRSCSVRAPDFEYFLSHGGRRFGGVSQGLGTVASLATVGSGGGISTQIESLDVRCQTARWCDQSGGAVESRQRTRGYLRAENGELFLPSGALGSENVARE
jgi:hypothetical protein